jgi:hypothetical protein
MVFFISGGPVPLAPLHKYALVGNIKNSIEHRIVL